MTILIVDDNRDAREIFCRMLGQEGFAAVRAVASVAEAMACLDEGCEFAAVIMDYAMPGCDGVTGCRMLRAHPRGRTVPVILASTNGSAAARLAAREAGAVAYLTKPIDRGALLAAVHTVAVERRRAEWLSGMERDLARGAAAQRELLRDAPSRFGTMRMAWRMLAGSGVSGDYINLFALDDRRLAFCMADVVGHGIGSALFAVSLHALLSPARAGAWVRDGNGQARAPHEVAALANREFPELGGGERYFTFIYGIVEPAAGRLQCVQAGHPGLILCGDGGNAEVLGGGDLPIGMFATASFHTIERQLAPASRLVVYSDGLIEARRGGQGEAFGQARLLQLVQAMGAADGEHVADEILRSVRAWLHPAPADDDQSLLVLSLA